MKYKKICYGFAGMILFLLFFMMVLPFIVEHQVVYHLESFMKRKVLLENVDINLFTLEFRLEKFAIQETTNDTPFIAFEEFYLNASWLSLFRLGIFVDQLYLKQPYFYGVMFSDSTVNFSDLIQSTSSVPKMKETQSETKPLRLDQLPISFDLKKIEIINGSLIFEDKKHALTHQLKQFNFEIPQVSNLMNTPDPTSLSLNFIFNDFHIDAQAQAHIFQETPKAKVLLKNRGGNFSFYQPYLSDILNWEVSSGKLTTDLGIQIEINKGTPDMIIQGKVAILDFVLKENSQHSLMSLPLFEINIHDARPLIPQVNLSLIKCVQPDIQVTRKKNGSLNWIPVFKTSHPSSSSHSTAKKSLHEDPSTAITAKSKKDSPLDIQVQDVFIEKGVVRVNDHSLKDPFETRLQNIQLKAKKINLLNQTIPSIELRTHILPHGKFTLKGAVNLKKRQWEGAVGIEDLDVSMVQPYLDALINGRLESGRLFVQMDTFVEQKKEHPHVRISGTLAMNHFVLREPVNKNELLTWNQFEVKKFNAGLFPHYVDIDEVRLNLLKAPLFLQSNGNLNWLALMKNQETNPLDSAPAESDKITPTSECKEKSISVSMEKTSSPPPLQRLKVRKVVLEDSTIRFVDLTMTPAFQAQMSQLNGQILGLDQDVSKSMDFVLNGKLNDLSPLQIVGQIAPFQKPLSLKVELRFQGIEVPVFTPYTNHYIGYPLDKGQLTLNLDYLLERNQLIAVNKVLINQLELGKKNKTAEVPSLPLKFALALLKDREGKIQLNIPIKGNLDDLNFSLKKVILQTLRNLIERMITAPFSFLSRLYGGGEDLHSLVFDYGTTDYGPSTRKKLKQVSDLMVNRPLLKLQLFAHLNTEEEIKALKKIRLKKEIELLKFKDQTATSKSLKNTDYSGITSKNYKQYLIQLYYVNFQKMPPLECQNRQSLEPTLLSNISVVSEDLEALSLKRMVMIRNTLVDTYHIASDRIFIREKKFSSEGIEDITQSQVLLKLQ
ncbi:MAG: DUF748 domain-containing protein [Candidatus Magnetomorum sp.]|nr:DUF748 domain-containing protein [Candidatus Magnetomorum sp.]